MGMKKIFFIVLIGGLLLFGCTPINKSLINETVNEMKFKENGKVVVVQESIKKQCKALIYEPNEFILDSVKTKHAYQDCMAAYGYTCIDNCAYEVK
jgi:hypothetical protein